MRTARRLLVTCVSITPLTEPPTLPHRGKKEVGQPMVHSYKFKRPYREQSERRSRSRSSDRASPATRPALDTRCRPVKHWGGVFQAGRSGGGRGRKSRADTNRLQIGTKRVSPDTIQALERRVGPQSPSSSRGSAGRPRGIMESTRELGDAESEEEDELRG